MRKRYSYSGYLLGYELKSRKFLVKFQRVVKLTDLIGGPAIFVFRTYWGAVAPGVKLPER